VSVQNTTYERSTLVNSEKYIGLDVHQATIVVAAIVHFSDIHIRKAGNPVISVVDQLANAVQCI